MKPVKHILKFIVRLKVFALLYILSGYAYVEEVNDFIMINGEAISFHEQAIQIPQYATFAEDLHANWKVEDVFDGKFDETFFKTDTPFGNFGFTSSAYWLKFEIDLSHSSVSDDLILVMNAATLDEVSLYIRDERGNITRIKDGL